MNCYESDPTDEKPCDCIGDADINVQLSTLNCAYGGTIPEALGSCTSLTSLCVARATWRPLGCPLTSALAPPLSLFQHRVLTNNSLTGTIPMSLMYLTSLETLVISQNTAGQEQGVTGLTGTIPAAIQYLPALT